MSGNGLIVRTLGLQRREELPYLRDVNAAIVDERHPIARWSIVLMLALLVGFLLWANWASLEVITLGQGKVIPTSREQVIQSLEAGILSELKVHEGDQVDKDQVLLRIDDTKAGAAYREGNSKVLALKASVARLRAEVNGTQPEFPADVRAEPDLVRNELALYQSRRRTVEEGVAGLRQSIALIQQELAMTEPLAAKGMTSEVDVLRLKRQANEARMNIDDRWNKYRADANTDLVKNEADLAQVSSNVEGRQDSLRRTVVRAPMRGTVKNIRVTTLGGVIQSGQDIMEIVPTDDTLLIEARVTPKDVAFLRPGLPATVKVSAYDYSIYGGLKGQVDSISPDTLVDEHRQGPGAPEAYYRVLVKTDKASLTHNGQTLPIIPGMIATVEILTGHRTVLQYLLKPVIKSREALRER